MLLKFMPSGKHYLKELLPTIKSMSMKLKRERSKNSYFSMIVPFWWQIPDAASLRNMVDQVQELDIKNLTDDGCFINLLFLYYQ